MTALKIKKVSTVIAVFQEAQLESSLHPQLIYKLTRVFEQINVRLFTLDFITCLKKALVVRGDGIHSGDCILAFAVKFLISIAGLNSTEDESPSEKALQFLYDVLRFMNENHRVPDMGVRKRICQFIAKFMLQMNAEVELDYKICDIVIEIMSERIKDKVPIVRTQAVLAIYRLQDGSDKNCPITQLLLNCIETDSCAEVRKLALSKISLKHKMIVRQLVDRVNDISEKVRKETYVILSKLHPQFFTIKDRKQLLYTGLYDNNEIVKNTVKNILLPAWLKKMENKYLSFLHSFNLDIESAELMTKALMSLIENSPEESKKIMDSCLDSLHLISFDKLTCKSAFYWRCYVFYQSGMVSEKNGYKWHSNKSYDATSSGLLPDLSIFCEYIKTYYGTLINQSGLEAWKKKEQEFILIQLIELCKVYDYADEVGRKELKSLCMELLQHVQFETIRPVVELYFMLQTNLNESICKITEVINDLLHPPNSQNEETTTLTSSSVPKEQLLSRSKCKFDLTPVQEQDLKYQLAQLEVRLEELKDQQEESVRQEDYSRAMILKTEISSIREKINSVKENLYAKPTSVCDDIPEVDEFSEENDENDLIYPLKNLDSDVIRRCLIVLRETLHLPFVKQLCPELRTLFQDFVLYACKSNNYLVAPLATEVLGSFCLRDELLAKDYFTTFFALCGNSDICVGALKVIFDLLLCFGPSAFNINSLNDDKNEHDKDDKKRNSRSSNDFTDNKNHEDDSHNENEEPEGMISGYTFISVLVDLLDDEYVEARCVVVHGLCKLMATGKLKSAKVLMRLILIWFHPTSRESVEIRDCLNFFFPFFARRCSWALPLFEEAFIPTMETLFYAPTISPLSGIDQKCVLKVLCDITSPNFINFENESADNIHCNLAVLICRTIPELTDPAHQAVLLKGLEYLDLASLDSPTRTTINNLLTKIIKKFKKKNYKKMVSDAEKFKVKLNTICESDKDVAVVPNWNTGAVSETSTSLVI